MKTSHPFRQIVEKTLDRAREHSDQAEVFFLGLKQRSVGHRNGKLRELDETENIGIGLRMIKDGRIAQASTSNFERAENLASQALQLVRYGEPVDMQFPAETNVDDSSEVTGDDAAASIESLVSINEILIDRIRTYDETIMANAGGAVEEISVHVMNSNGFDHEYSRRSYQHYAAGVLAEGKNILTCYDFHLGQNPITSPSDLATQIIDQIRIGRKNVPFSSEVLPILFTPSAVTDIMAAFSAGISGSGVARGISPLVGKLGEKIIDERVSILDDAFFPGAAGSQPFDDEGVPCRTKYLVRNGVLENYLLDLKSATRLKLAPTGNGFRYTSLIKSRSYVPSPSPSLTNMIIPEGERSHDEIIRDFRRILVVDQLTGVLLGNLINGDWSGNIEYGILYENGEPLGRIKNAMTGGNFYTMFSNQYVESSRDRKWTAGFGGSAGSNLFPYILCDAMNVSG